MSTTVLFFSIYNVFLIRQEKQTDMKNAIEIIIIHLIIWLVSKLFIQIFLLWL